ncbi:MAG TPA: ABC transporter ATP-binding protein [Actinomycetota bacterium]|nr:ABC transporter ATP-binding protein [Actinomycetota bacterium]
MTAQPLLDVRDLHAHYGHVHALRGLTLQVKAGEIVALLGANGAGKTTTLRAVMGLLRPTSGDIRLDGQSIVGLQPHQVVARGVVMVPEGRRVFPNLSVEENLRMGGYTLTDRATLQANLDTVYGLFPVLAERRRQLGSSLSGGEQQMLALGRALMVSPRLLLLDEPSLGLAPLVVRSIFRVVQELAGRGVTILLVEQNVRQALRVADRAYLLEVGRLVHAGASAELMEEALIRKAYLGVQRP